MLATVKELYGFTVSEVLEPNWNALQKTMLEAETVDSLLRGHIDFLDTCLKECMLTMFRLLKVSRLAKNSQWQQTDSSFVFVNSASKQASTLDQALQRTLRYLDKLHSLFSD